MKILFAVVSCHRREFAPEATSKLHQNAVNDRVEWVRDTWLSDTAGKVDVKFFYGENKNIEPKDDEVFLNVGDDYFSLVAKVRAIVQWAFDHGYDYLLKLDDDVYVDVTKTLAGFDPAADYRGTKNTGHYGINNSPDHKREIDFACGPAYWLSRKAMGVVLESPTPSTPYEDRAMGDMLTKGGIPLIPSSELQVCLCRNCLTVTKPWAQVHVEDPQWRERFRLKFGLQLL